MSLLCYSEDQLSKTPEIYPLSLCEIKRHLRIHNDFVDDDAYLIGLRDAATQLASNYLNKAIAKTKNVLRIDGFNNDTLKIYEGNFLSFVSAVDASAAAIGTIHQTSVHYDYFNVEWASSISANPATITFYTGYEEDETPAIIKQAILIIIANLYDSQRSSVSWGGYSDNEVWKALLNYDMAVRF